MAVGFFEVPGQPLSYTPNVLTAVDIDVNGFIQFYLKCISTAFSDCRVNGDETCS